MEKFYKICGISVSCDFRYSMMINRAEKYAASAAAAEIEVKHYPERLDELKKAEPALTFDDCETIDTARQFYLQLLHHGGFMLHSSAVVLDGEAYLFSAPSGTGKSTHTEQWLKLFGERAKILNDDKPAIMLRDTITACGTPWSGKSDLNLNLEVPLQGICILERSEVNFIEPLPAEKAVFALLDQTLRPEGEEEMLLLLDMLDRVTREVKIWRMGCNISVEAARVAYEGMTNSPNTAKPLDFQR